MIKISPIFPKDKNIRNKPINPFIKFSPFDETPQRSNIKKNFQKIFSNNPILGRSIFTENENIESFFNEKENNNNENTKINKKITIVSSLFVKPEENIRNKYLNEINFTEKNNKNNNIIIEDKEINYKCSCSKTGCNKNYCQCFSQGKYCLNCNCKDCKNKDLDNSLSFFMEKKNKNYFKKILNICTCSKSNCNKKYCDCFRKGNKCSSKCRCVNCHNCDNNIDNLKENRCIGLSIVNNKFIFEKDKNFSNISFFTLKIQEKLFLGNKRKNKNEEQTNFTSEKKDKFINFDVKKKEKRKIKKFKLK